jgi:prolyl-tRNA editing enzyme YbaK/EbsC (Cys-tRNA(Pro) deacylase)
MNPSNFKALLLDMNHTKEYICIFVLPATKVISVKMKKKGSDGREILTSQVPTPELIFIIYESEQ